MKYYFLLQYRRISRIIDASGFAPFLVIISFPVVFYLLSDLFFDRLTYSTLLYLFVAILLVFSLSTRNRNDFIKNIFLDIDFKLIRLTENILVSAPFIIYLLYRDYYREALVLVFLSALLSQFNKFSIYTFIIPTPFAQRPYEFIVGFRKSFWVFPIAYFLCYMAVKVGNFNLGIFSFLLVMITTLSYYSVPEPIFYVWIHNQNSKDFLYDKIKTAIIFNLLLSSPIIIALLMRFSLYNIDLILIFTLIGVLFVLSNLLGKYSLFPSSTTFKRTILIALCMVLPPMLLFVLPYFYYQSQKSLSNYLK